MTFNPSIPLATDLLSTSQGDLKNNFSQLNTQFAVDHVAFNTGSGNGDGTHKKITFDAAIAAPSPSGTISNIYPANDSATIVYPFFKNATKTRQLAGGTYTYTPTLTSTGITFTYSSQVGKFYIAGGITYFFGKIVTSAETAALGTPLQISLPTTAASTEAGGSGFVEFNGGGLVLTTCTIAPSGTVMINVATNFTGSLTGRSYWFSGFYL